MARGFLEGQEPKEDSNGKRIVIMKKTNKKRIIFLDIDGVLNTGRWFFETNGKVGEDGFYTFDPVAVENLRKIISETGADIVISSSWKCYGKDSMLEMWSKRNMPGKVIDVTPDYYSDEMLPNVSSDSLDIAKLKGFEIAEWLSLHEKSVSQYVIIDDDDCVLPAQREHLILTNSDLGITDRIARKIILFFSIM